MFIDKKDSKIAFGAVPAHAGKSGLYAAVSCVHGFFVLTLLLMYRRAGREKIAMFQPYWVQ